MIELSAAEARRMALAAQGFGTPLPARVAREHLVAIADRLGAVQIDSVNVLVRSHYLPAFARLGAYSRAALDALSHDAPRSLFEYWGHEASLLPVALYPAMRWRMDRAHEHAWGNMRRIARSQQSLVADIMALVSERGPIAASEIELGERGEGGWWGWSQAKTVLEWLFWSGRVTSARRRGFERLYDLPERVIPKAILKQRALAPDVARMRLVARAALAAGVATATDLRDYYRLDVAGTRAAIDALVEAGTLVPARVEGWAKPAFAHRDAPPPPKRTAARALLSPFDSLIWARERTERMWGMKVRIELYTPAPKRVHGYYVLPFLLGDALVARVDLKADRAAGVLRVQAAHAEGTPTPKLAAALTGELARMAAWLGLECVEATGKGDLGPALRRALRR